MQYIYRPTDIDRLYTYVHSLSAYATLLSNVGMYAHACNRRSLYHPNCQQVYTSKPQPQNHTYVHLYLHTDFVLAGLPATYKLHLPTDDWQAPSS